MAWIESHQSLGTHRKLLALCRLLNIEDTQAVGMLQFLWWWCLDNAPDGELTAADQLDIARICHMSGRRLAVNGRRTAALATVSAVIWQSLAASGWVDVLPDGRTVLHDWDDYAGRLVSKRKANADRMRIARASRVQHTLSERAGATVPNRTLPNRTKEISKEEGRVVGEGVVMSDEQMKGLVARFGDEGARQRVERLSLYKLSTGKKYKSDYHTVLNWERMNPGGAFGNRLNGNTSGNPRPLVPRSQYTRPEALRHGLNGGVSGGGAGATTPDPSGEQP